MFCPNCGTNVPDGTRFCASCGTQLPTAQQSAPQNVYQPAYQAPVSQPVVAQGMGWFKFLIYFSLFASAVVCAISGFMCLTGSQYGSDGEADLVYAMFEDLKTVDMIVGVLMLACAALAVYTRFQLSGYKVNGPKFLTFAYLASAVTNLIYYIGFVNAFGEYAQYAETEMTQMTSQMIAGIVGSMAMIVINNIYFKKRAHLFVK